MKIGYPCINLSLECRPSRTFRLSSYSEGLLRETVRNNLDCMHQILDFNLEHNIMFFRITSDLIPFASHPICRFNWQKHFADQFQALGDLIRKSGFRISMHPDQFTLINSNDEGIFERSRKELIYHARILDLMNLDDAAKIQIHVGGAYKDKVASMNRFIARFDKLEEAIRRRLVIENDDKIYGVSDCLSIYERIGIPVLFDVFHHKINNSGESNRDCIRILSRAWRRSDGLLMVDYSSQQKGERKGTHAHTINVRHFRRFLEETRGWDFDVMLEIKNKERSAIKAIEVASTDSRLPYGKF